MNLGKWSSGRIGRLECARARHCTRLLASAYLRGWLQVTNHRRGGGWLHSIGTNDVLIELITATCCSFWAF
ncbi:hypothetical protein MHYP_G00148740 [Metynnis hypsauchen]